MKFQVEFELNVEALEPVRPTIITIEHLERGDLGVLARWAEKNLGRYLGNPRPMTANMIVIPLLDERTLG